MTTSENKLLTCSLDKLCSQIAHCWLCLPPAVMQLPVCDLDLAFETRKVVTEDVKIHPHMDASSVRHYERPLSGLRN